uniref:Uncharacterized protein n=1 Tax=viral metagenome TaxID=1070528 RepID=A0A6M3K7Z0_9ZZZZ
MDVLRQLAELDDAKKDFEAKLKIVKDQLTVVEDEAFKRMETESVQSIALEGVLYFRKTTKKYAAKADVRDKANMWLKEHGFGDLFKETIDPRTLSSELTRAVEQEEIIIPEELFNNVILNQIGRRKAVERP